MLTILVQMDKEGMNFVARYENVQLPIGGLAKTGHADGSSSVNWQVEYPKHGVGRSIADVETYCLQQFQQLKEGGAFNIKDRRNRRTTKQ